MSSHPYGGLYIQVSLYYDRLDSSIIRKAKEDAKCTIVTAYRKLTGPLTDKSPTLLESGLF